MHKHFPDNLRRLIGLHGLTATEAAALVSVDKSTISLWMSGKRTPNLETALRLADLFGISPDRLTSWPFKDLLREGIADPDRFEQVEARIKRSRVRLRAVS